MSDNERPYNTTLGSFWKEVAEKEAERNAESTRDTSQWWLISDEDVNTLLKRLQYIYQKAVSSDVEDEAERLEHVLHSGLNTTDCIPDDFR